MAKRKPRVTLVSLDRKIDQNTACLDRKIDQSTARLDRKIDQSMARLDRKIDESTTRLDGRIDKLNRKFDDLSRKFDNTQMLVEEVRDDVRKVAEYLVVMDQKWDRRFDNHETCIVNLEKHTGFR